MNENFDLKKLDLENWGKYVENYIKNYFYEYKIYGRDGKTIEHGKLLSYINTILVNNALSDIYTGIGEYFPGTGICKLSIYDLLSSELENILIEKMYQLNKVDFCENLEDFTDYVLSEHTYLLKDYICNLLDNYTPGKLKQMFDKLTV